MSNESGIMGLRIVDCSYPVPLKSIDVDVAIKGFIANVTPILVYKNETDKTIQVVYRFPIDEASAVYRFEAEVDGRVIIGECQERRQGKRTYEEAMYHGQPVATIEEEDFISDIFSIKVGNIPPGGEVKITFGYVTELKLLTESGVTRFTLHTLLNPRYNPNPVPMYEMPRPISLVYIEGRKQPYDFNFKAKVGNSAPINNIVSAKDELKVEYNSDKTEASVSLAESFIADHDFTLEISYSDPFKPHVIIEKGVATEVDRCDAESTPSLFYNEAEITTTHQASSSSDSQGFVYRSRGLLKEDLVMLNFIPELKYTDYTSKHEFIIIVDRSGSMQGSRIESAQETLLLFLKSLPISCHFNIIGFGSHFDKLFPDGSKEVTEKNMEAAMRYQEGLAADFGCTELLLPLTDVYSKPVMTTHSRQLFILTDGAVSNTSAVINTVQQNAHNTRVFTFGIGYGASTALVEGIARAGRGRAEFILDKDRMQPIIIRSLKAAMQHNVTDLHLDWQLKGSPKLIQIPKQLPSLFSGDRLIVYAVSSGQAVLDGKVHLKGKIGQRELDFGLDIHSGQVKSSEDRTLPLHRLAAKSQILKLQDEENKNEMDNKAAVILLSTASNVISRHTSMVAVDKVKSAKLTGKKTVHVVPLLRDHQSLWFSGRDLMPYRTHNGRILMLRDIPMPILRGGGGAVPVESEHIKVVRLQTFCGSWKLNSNLMKVLNVKLKKMKSARPQQISDEVWGTVLALAVLNMKYSDNKDEWEMIEMKAQQWLNTQQLHNHSLSSLLDLAKAAVTN